MGIGCYSSIIKIIDLGIVKNKNSVDEWLTDVYVKTGIPKREIKQRIDRLIEKYPVWDSEFGSFTFHR